MVFRTLFMLVVLSLSPNVWAESLRVVASTSDLASIAQAVGGDQVIVTGLADGNKDVHFVEPRPSMVVRLKDADLLIRIGMEYDLWIDGLVKAARNGSILPGRQGYLDVSGPIAKLEIPSMGERFSLADVHAQGNPHYWLDPLNAKIIAQQIAERLTLLAPEHAPYFQQNLSEFANAIDRKMKEWQSSLKPFKGERIVTYHKSWIYFAHRFGIEIPYEIESKPGIAPSAAYLNDLVRNVRNGKIRIILIEPFYNLQSAQFVQKQTGAKVLVLPNSVTYQNGINDYVDLIDSIVRDLKEALESI